MNSATKFISELFNKVEANNRLIEFYTSEYSKLKDENSKLLAELRKIYETEVGAKNVLPLQLPKIDIEFDHHKRTIYCFGKTIKLGEKAFLFLQTIYHGENHSADLDDIIETVWGKEKKDTKTYKKTIWTPEKKRINLAKMVSNNTVLSMKRNINCDFLKAVVPLKIISEKISKFSNPNHINSLQLIIF
jgi:hypothetical protein